MQAEPLSELVKLLKDLNIDVKTADCGDWKDLTKWHKLLKSEKNSNSNTTEQNSLETDFGNRAARKKWNSLNNE